MRRQLSTLFFALVTIISTFGFAAPAAFAHAGLVSANPAANVEISEMPVTVQLTFTEDLMMIGDQNVNTVSMTDPAGSAVSLSEFAVSGAVLSANLPEATFASGTYTVSYSIVSADGHKLKDSYQFSLNAPAPVDAPAPAVDSSGVLPLPIVIAIAAVILLGGFLIYTRGRREE